MVVIMFNFTLCNFGKKLYESFEWLCCISVPESLGQFMVNTWSEALDDDMFSSSVHKLKTFIFVG